jgi:hypothetical protein
MSNLEILSRVGDIQPTKYGIDLVAESIAEVVNGGHHNPLEVLVRVSAIESLCKAVRDKLSDTAQAELDKYPKAKADVLGASVSRMESVKYDYTTFPEWVEAERQIAELKEKQKQIEEEEKKWRRGELAVKSVTSTFKIQLAK